MKFSLDRVESGIAVCLAEEPVAPPASVRYDIPLDEVPALKGLADGTLFDADVGEDGRLYHIRVLHKETADMREKNKARLQALFARSKKNN